MSISLAVVESSLKDKRNPIQQRHGRMITSVDCIQQQTILHCQHTGLKTLRILLKLYLFYSRNPITTMVLQLANTPVIRISVMIGSQPSIISVLLMALRFSFYHLLDMRTHSFMR